MNKLILGNSLEELKKIEDNSVDSIVTDPPYHLVSIVKRFGGEKSRNTPAMNTKEGRVFARKAKGFMGKEWDGVDENGIGIAYNVDLWAECLRVLKPGGHLLAFSGTRTYHRMAVAIEDSGFEIRDMIEWVYGSGFPKSLNIGKAVDKLQGNEREEYLADIAYSDSDCWGTPNNNITSKGVFAGDIYGDGIKESVKGGKIKRDKGTSEWEGWGTALKPAHEPICMARKPLVEKTVAENVLKYGTGGINIDESRVEATQEYANGKGNPIQKLSGDVYGFAKYDKLHTRAEPNNMGRFPANLIHDNSEEVRECFPNESERFFKSIIYQAKASKSERNKGCEELEEKESKTLNEYKNPSEGRTASKSGSPKKNNHPTVKPVALMEYLIKMVTPTNGIVLDPFMGSGSTGVACVLNDFEFVGIDLDKDYCEIARARIEGVKETQTKMF